MLEATIRRIGCSPLDAVMVPPCSCDKVARGIGLRDQLGAQHGLAIPARSAVNGDLGTFVDGSVGRIGVGRIEVDVVGDVAGAVDVVLVRTDFVGPGPYFRGISASASIGRSIDYSHTFGQLRGVSHIIETSVPHDSSSSSAGESADRSNLGEHFEKIVFCKS